MRVTATPASSRPAEPAGIDMIVSTENDPFQPIETGAAAFARVSDWAGSVTG
jgi:hypothetical protein